MCSFGSSVELDGIDGSNDDGSHTIGFATATGDALNHSNFLHHLRPILPFIGECLVKSPPPNRPNPLSCPRPILFWIPQRISVCHTKWANSPLRSSVRSLNLPMYINNEIKINGSIGTDAEKSLSGSSRNRMNWRRKLLENTKQI